jgi:hypothetical protein
VNPSSRDISRIKLRYDENRIEHVYKYPYVSLRTYGNDGLVITSKYGPTINPSSNPSTTRVDPSSTRVMVEDSNE